MAGVMRSPFTSIVFALELTHNVNALLALLVACTIAHLVSVLTLKRSILTEKIARRGYHVTREYEIDPLHALLVRDVMADRRAHRAARHDRQRAVRAAARRAATSAANASTRSSTRIESLRRRAGVLRCARRAPHQPRSTADALARPPLRRVRR